MTVTLLQGDCRGVLPTLPADSFDCVVTSPPYWGLRDYGVDGQIGLEPTLDAYVETMVGVFREVRRVLKPDGTCWLNLGDSYSMNTKGSSGKGEKQVSNAGTILADRRWSIQRGLKPKDLCGVPWRVAFALQADGWWLRSAIIWAKPNPMPESVTDRPTSAYEMVFLLTKSERYFYDAEAIAEEVGEWSKRALKSNWIRRTDYGTDEVSGRARSGDAYASKVREDGTRNARNVWTIATQPYKGSHFATMPPDLAERCIKAGSSEKGCCPQCGKAWERIVERSDIPDASAKGSRFDAGKTAERDDGGRTQTGERFLKRANGWRATCGCLVHEPTPAHVLDPFGGAGTSGLVADRLGRDATLIEFNPAYREMQRERLVDDSPLFAEVEG